MHMNTKPQTKFSNFTKRVRDDTCRKLFDKRFLITIDQLVNSGINFLTNLFFLNALDVSSASAFAILLSYYAILSSFNTAFIVNPILYRTGEGEKVPVLFTIVQVVCVLLIVSYFSVSDYDNVLSAMAYLVVIWIVRDILRVTFARKGKLKLLFSFTIFGNIIPLCYLFYVGASEFASYVFLISFCIAVLTVISHENFEFGFWKSINKIRENFSYSFFAAIENVLMALVWQLPILVLAHFSMSNLVIEVTKVMQFIGLSTMMLRALTISMAHDITRINNLSGIRTISRSMILLGIIFQVSGLIVLILLREYGAKGFENLDFSILLVLAFTYLLIYGAKAYEWHYRTKGNQFHRFSHSTVILVSSGFYFFVVSSTDKLGIATVLIYYSINYLLQYISFKYLVRKYQFPVG